MKKRIVTTVTALGLTISMGTGVFAVKDIDKHWAKTEINYLIDKKVMSGYDDDSFRPENKISRVEFLKIVNNVFENRKSEKIDFKDVARKDWFYNDVEKAVGAGYTLGYDDNTFRPNEAITRQEASKILVIAGGLEGIEPAEKVDFKDRGKIDSWALDYIDIMVEKGYISGYDDQTFKPRKNLTRAEAAKILVDMEKDQAPEEEPELPKPLPGGKPGEGELGEEKPLVPEIKPVYSVQVESFKEEKDALELGQKLLKANYKETFISRDSYHIYYLIANDFKTQAEAESLKESLEKDGYKPMVVNKNFRDYDLIQPKEEEVVLTDLDILAKHLKDLPRASKVDQLTDKLLIDLDRANSLYNKINDVEKKKLDKKDLDKLAGLEKKVDSLKTDIQSASKTTVDQAQEWARTRGAHERFVDIAPEFWKYGELTGINPEILYAQAAKETNFGKYTGSVKPEMNNWAGIKTNNPSGDKTYDHEIFPTPEDGVRAQFNHMGIYVGVDPIGEPHPRWYITSKVSWRGQVKKVEDLGGKWAPNRDYGISIMRDYVKQIYRLK